MPYDPRMLQLAQRGVRMMGPEQRDAFADPRSKPQPQWWDQAVQVGQPANRPVNTPDDRTDYERKQPPSLLDMMMSLGRMTRPEYDRAIQGPGAYGISPRDAARAGPWAFLGSLGMPSSGGKP
jgi:hypothetical protein